MMNKQTKKKNVLKKVRYRNGTDIFYTWSIWETKEIDGVEYLPVMKWSPEDKPEQIVHFIRKDTMEYVK